MRISSKRQIAIPKHVMTALNLKPGDEIEIRIEDGSARLLPITTFKVPRDQAWFWTKEWQDKELEASEDIAAGNFRDFETLDDLMQDTRLIQASALRSHDELVGTRKQVQEAEAKIRDLEQELSLVSELVHQD